MRAGRIGRQRSASREDWEAVEREQEEGPAAAREAEEGQRRRLPSGKKLLRPGPQTRSVRTYPGFLPRGHDGSDARIASAPDCASHVWHMARLAARVLTAPPG